MLLQPKNPVRKIMEERIGNQDFTHICSRKQGAQKMVEPAVLGSVKYFV